MRNPDTAPVSIYGTAVNHSFRKNHRHYKPTSTASRTSPTFAHIGPLFSFVHPTYYMQRYDAVGTAMFGNKGGSQESKA
jgi:hypothetical protein